MRAYVESYGCTLNHGEADEIREALSSKGWHLVDDPNEAELAVIATCIVIESTEKRMLRRVEELSHVPRLIVTGCLPQCFPEETRSLAAHAEFVPPGDGAEIDKIIKAVGPTIDAVPEARGYAIVPIATGCAGDCSYCITRLARGRLRSRSADRIVERVSSLSKPGPLEIRLTSQDSAVYGNDTGSDLVSLLRRLSLVDADFRIRVGMMNPGNALRLADGLVEAFQDRKVFKFAHVPVQSGSDRLLAEMNRGYTVDDFRQIVNRLRSEIPEITVSTDIIVGYPSESEPDHESSLELVRSLCPDIVNVTRFSARPGTRAASAGAPVVGWRAKDRSRELTKLRFEISHERNQRLIGQEFLALATEVGKDSTTILRNDAYKQIVVESRLPLRQYHRVKVVDAKPTYLIGELIEYS